MFADNAPKRNLTMPTMTKLNKSGDAMVLKYKKLDIFANLLLMTPTIMLTPNICTINQDKATPFMPAMRTAITLKATNTKSIIEFTLIEIPGLSKLYDTNPPIDKILLVTIPKPNIFNTKLDCCAKSYPIQSASIS